MWNCNLSDVHNEKPWWLLSLNGVYSIMLSIQSKSSWRNSWCSLERTSWLGSGIAHARSASFHVFSVVYWSSSGNPCNFAPVCQLIQYFSWFKNYNQRILSRQTALASWGKSKLEARYRREITSVPLEQGGLQGANPLVSLDILRNSRRERDMEAGKNANENVDLQSGQVCCISKEQILFWPSGPLLCSGGELSYQGRRKSLRHWQTTWRHHSLRPLEIMASGNCDTPKNSKTKATDASPPEKITHIRNTILHCA